MGIRGTGLLALALVALAASAEAGEGEWTSLRGGPANPGSCRWEAPASAPDTAVREWQFQGRGSRRYKPGLAVWASPAIAVVGGRPMAFIGGCDQTMHALDLAAKEEKWAVITNGEIAEAPAITLLDGSPVVFWGSADRTVYAARAEAEGAADGRLLWTRQIATATSTAGDVQLSAPLVHDGMLYISCFVYDRSMARSDQKGWLVALDARTGEERWRREASQGFLSSPTGCVIDGRFIIFLAARKGLLQAFDVSGNAPKPLWKYQMPHEVLGSPAIAEGAGGPTVFLGSKFGNLIALDARTGKFHWKQMAGNWIDNSVCVGEVAGESVVFAGSHDYNVHAFRASDGMRLWQRRLGAEVYSAPAFFHLGGKPALAVASLDNHVYVIDAATGAIITAYFTGNPIWDKVAKGETLWGSPAVLEAAGQTAVIHGSFDATVYTLPVEGECALRTKVRSAASLWWSLLVTLVIFGGVVLPIVLRLPPRRAAAS